MLGEEAGEAEHQRPYVEVLRLALAGHPAPGAAMGVSARIRELQPDRWQAQVAEAWALVHASNFEALGPLLARLVPALEGASRRPGDAAAPTRALILLADAYQVAAAMLVKVGDVGAGWIAADRAIAAGERCGDRCLVMAGQLRMAHTFVDSAEENLALHVLRQAVALAGGLAADTEAGLVSLTGACALLLAVLEARRGNATEARRHLKAAVRLARRLGEDRNDYGTEFGPTNVALHEVAVEVELGNASEALRLAAGVDTSALSAERRARFLVDMARAHVQRRALAPASTIWPAAGRYRVFAHYAVESPTTSRNLVASRSPPTDNSGRPPYVRSQARTPRADRIKPQEDQAMKLPIDTSGITFIAAGAPEAAVDYDTKAAKVDESGQAIFGVQVVALSDGGAEVISVKVAGAPKGVSQGTALKLVGLTAQPWSMGDRSGVAFRAAQIEPVGAGRPAS